MNKNKKCDAKKTMRLPTALVNRIEKKNNIPNCKSSSDKYRFFLESGVEAYDEYQKIISDPDYNERAKNMLENIFANEMVVENLMIMDVSKFKGLSMAIDMVRNKRKI